MRAINELARVLDLAPYTDVSYEARYAICALQDDNAGGETASDEFFLQTHDAEEDAATGSSQHEHSSVRIPAQFSGSADKFNRAGDWIMQRT